MNDVLFFVASTALIFILASMGMGFAVVIERFVRMEQARQETLLADETGMKTMPDETASKAPLSGQ